MTTSQFFKGRAIGFSIVIIIALAFFAYKKYTSGAIPPEPVATTTVQNTELPVFTRKTEYSDSKNLDGLPKTKLSLEAKYADGTIQTKHIDTPDGSCNALDDREADQLASTTIFQCYAAGFGYRYKIVKGENSYVVMRKSFEEGSPEYNPPEQVYEAVAEFMR